VSNYVKFTYERARVAIGAFDKLAELNTWRRKLLELGLIGVDSNGVGFGNLSVRDGATTDFYITGSATGGLPALACAHCARVVAYDFEKNWLRYEGSAIPSSEALTHAAIYEADPTACAIIHFHDAILWATLLERVPTSSKGVSYGTPEMAYEIARLFKVSDVRRRKLFVMAGHEGGIVAFGKNLEGAFEIVMRERKGSSPCIENGFHERTSARHEG
jgi:L-ribulose-5-phosphate 4-epimerase